MLFLLLTVVAGERDGRGCHVDQFDVLPLLGLRLKVEAARVAVNLA